MLTACGALGEAPEAVRPGAPDAAETVRGADGPLALTRWPAEGEAKALVLALHGYGDYAETIWPDAAETWAAAGLEVWAYDQRGFGRNPSNRDWQGAEAMIDDLAAVAEAARAARPDLPLAVVGHSMGGGVALAAAGEGRLNADALVLLAPAVWGGDSLSPVYRAGAWLGAKLFPETRFSRRASPIPLRPTDNDEKLRKIMDDPLRFAAPNPREFMGLIQLMDRAVAAAPNADLPVLTVMGANDEIVPEDSVRAAHAALPGPKTFDYVADGWHMLPIDLGAAAVNARVAEWILETTR
jgi:alpha-beta hydrolase superfamily lysophospholipase